MSKSTADDTIHVERLSDIENFQIWKFQVNILFRSHELYEIVHTDTPGTQHDTAWKKKDATAQKIIVTTIEKKPMMHIMNCNTAREMWKKICTIYERDNEQQKCSLMQSFYTLTLEKGADLASYVSKLKNIAARLEALDAKITDQMIISKIIATLPASYKHFASAWESTAKGDRTLENLTARLIAEEMRSIENKNEEKAVAFKTSNGKCRKCHKPGHYAKDCRTKSHTNNEEIRCFKCNKTGHMARSCNEKRTKNEKTCSICKKTNHKEEDCFFRKKKDAKEEDKGKVSFLANGMEESDTWIVDSGSTSNMTNRRDYLENFREEKSSIGVAKKNETMTARGQGAIEFQKCKLKEVTYVPELSSNLLSVNAITNSGGEVNFTKDKVKISFGNETLLTGNKTENGLFQVKLKPVRQGESHMANNQTDNAIMWHRKLGHISKENLQFLQTISNGMEINHLGIKRLNEVCDICQKAKQTRLKFNNSREKATRPLQIIHTDVCGPINPNTWDGNRYFVTFLDDYTHFTMVYLIKNKDEVPSKIKQYTERIEAKWNKRISKIRCDNGREFINNQVVTWCENKGIELDTTVTYTPQLNGKAERLNRTLMDKVRALLFDSGLKKQMWGEALYTSVYLLNRSPTDRLKVTPYEMWEGRKPNMKNLQLFGCEAYAKVLGPLKKLDQRSEKYVFIGYAPVGYRLWDAQKQKIKIARDVKFGLKTNKELDEIQNRKHIDLINENDNEVQMNTKQEDEEEQEEKIDDFIDLVEIEDIIEDETQPSEEDNNDTEEIRRSKRNRKQPDRYRDCAMLTYKEAITGCDKQKWQRAITEEKNSLKENNTWEALDARKVVKCKPLHTKWVFKVKPDGRYKARLVVKGCEQRKDIDYIETYSPVISMTALRSLFAIAAQMNYKIVLFDIKTAFLYGELKDDIYVYPPEGYNEKEKLFKLKKALYGLKQAPLTWNKRFSDFLKKKGFQPLKTEQCLFKKTNGELILGIYVDDGIIIGNNTNEIRDLIMKLKQEFKVTVAYDANNFVGFEICKDQGVIRITQKEYTEKLLENCQKSDAKPMKIPIVKSEPIKTETEDDYPYRETVGSLLYLSTKARPDIAYAVNFCSRFVEQQTKERIRDLNHILRYLNGSRYLGIEYKNNNKNSLLEAYCDADYAGDPETRKSTTGYIIYFAGGAISWCSRKQPVIALSSTEAEYIAAAECCKELLYLKSLLEELLLETVDIELNVDNQSAIALMKNGVINKRSKHIDVKFRFVHELVKENIVEVKYCPTDCQIADMFTKPLNTTKFINFRNRVMTTSSELKGSVKKREN